MLVLVFVAHVLDVPPLLLQSFFEVVVVLVEAIHHEDIAVFESVLEVRYFDLVRHQPAPTVSSFSSVEVKCAS